MENGRKLRVLSLDGGGVRGLSSLFILESVMQNVQQIRASADEPYQVFDAIFGTSAGGLNAIMLGRLQLPIRDCITHLKEVSRTVFTSSWTWISYLRQGGNRYSEQTMCNAINNIGGAQSLMQSHDVPHCWVVCRESNSSGRVVGHHAVCLATFNNGEPNCTVSEAGRATSAAPTFFPPQRIANPPPPRFFVDGGLRFNNPIKTFMDHYTIQDCERYTEECYVSIGTGRQDGRNDDDTGWWRISSAFGLGAVNDAINAATDAENDEEWFQLLIGARRGSGRTIHYYRFNCPYGLGSIGLDNVDQLSNIQRLTRKYLSQSGPMINNCAAALA